MSLLTARNTQITKSAHTTSIAVGLLALPIVAVLAAAYGPAAVHFLASVFVRVGSGSSKISDLSVDTAFAAIIGVIVVAIGLAVHEHRQDEDKEIYDVR
ncbi:MAG: hypothetical protein ACTHJM_16435 [Marmoricola sp.]